MKEDKRGDATESQHHPVAVSQCLLMIYSCGDDGEGKKSEQERMAHPLLSLPISPAVA